MQFKQIQNLKDKSSGLQSQREKESEKLLMRGLACIEYGFQESFENPKVLEEAISCLIDAMKKNRRDPRAALSLSYLFFVVSDLEIAREYITIALEINPDEPISLALSESIREEIIAEKKAKSSGGSPSLKAFQASKASSDEDIDYDALYDKLEGFIIEQVKAISSQPAPKAESQSASVKAMKAMFKQLRSNYQKIIADMQIVDKEIDTGDLKQIMLPMEQSLKRYTHALELSELFQSMRQDIDNEMKLVQQLIGEAKTTKDKADIPVLEDNLDAFLDRCDNFADRIDDLEKKKEDVSHLSKAYQRLVDQIEDFQDTVDDTIDRLT